MFAASQAPLFKQVFFTSPLYTFWPGILTVLAEDAIRSAIRDYHSKRKSLAQQNIDMSQETLSVSTSKAGITAAA